MAVPAALAQESEAPLWTTEPTRIDRANQTFERLPAKTVVRDTRIWIVVPPRIRVLDSRSFEAGETIYEFADIRAVKPKRHCVSIEGGRWPCGRMASIHLGNLVRGKRMLCDVEQGDQRLNLRRCTIGSRDVAATIVQQGYGMALRDDALLSVQAEAQRLAAKGLWRNRKCASDFDTC